MSGVLGRLFREFSVTICVAILISGVVSVTLTPMLCSRFLKKPKKHGHRSGLSDVFERGFAQLLHGYDVTLQFVLRHRPATMIAFGFVLVTTGWLFVIVPKGFIPEQDTDQIAVTTEAAQGASFDKLVEYQDQVAKILQRDPNVDGLVSTVGGTASQTLGGPNLGQIVVHLKPRAERKLLVGEIIERLRPQMAKVTGMDVFMQNPPTVRIGGQVSKSLYQYSMQSPDKAVLYEAGRKVRDTLAQLPGLADVTSDLGNHQSPGHRRHRPGPGRGARRHGGPDRRRVLRRVRTALGVDNLRAGERVQSAPGAAAGCTRATRAPSRCSTSRAPRRTGRSCRSSSC